MLRDGFWDRGKVLFDVIDIGVGHVRRTVPIAEELYNDGCSDLVYLGNPSLLSEKERDIFSSVHPTTSFLGIEPDVKLSAFTNFCRLAPEIALQIASRRSIKYIKIRNVRVAFIDSDQSKVFTPQFFKRIRHLFEKDLSRYVPVVAFATNQLVLDYKIPGLGPLERFITYEQRRLMDCVIVYDLPKEYEKFSLDPRAFRVAEHDEKNRIKFVGQPCPKEPEYVPQTAEDVRIYLEKIHGKKLRQMEGRIPILCSVTDNKIRELFLQSADDLNKRGYVPIISNTKEPSSESYATIFDNEDYRRILYSPAVRAIAARPGHTTISWSAYCGKAMVLIPITNHSEQIRNAKRVEKIGAGKYLLAEDVRKDPKIFVEAVADVDCDEAIKKRAEQWSEVSRKPENNYIKNCVGIIKRLYDGALF